MRDVQPGVWVGLLAALFLAGPTSHAEDAPDKPPAYDSAVYLLRQSIKPQQDGTDRVMLRSLRAQRDPALRTMFKRLAGSDYGVYRVHGLLGLAETGDPPQLDLAALAELEDPAEFSALLGAAMDDDLVEAEAIANISKWKNLKPTLQMALSFRARREGAAVEVERFVELLEIDIAEPEEGIDRRLTYSMAALLLASEGQAKGQAALMRLATMDGESSDAVLAQLFQISIREQTDAIAPLALKLASDRDDRFRLVALNAALFAEAPEAWPIWIEVYQSSESLADRIRLAGATLTHAKRVPDLAWSQLTRDLYPAIQAIGQAGQALAEGTLDPAESLRPVAHLRIPVLTQTIFSLATQAEQDVAPGLFQLIVEAPLPDNARIAATLRQLVAASAQAWVERYPDTATAPLSAILAKPTDHAPDIVTRQRDILSGLANAKPGSITPLAEALGDQPYDDFTAEIYRLLIRVNHGLALTDERWNHVENLIRGVGQTPATLRIRLAWLYLKHHGVTDQALGRLFD